MKKKQTLIRLVYTGLFSAIIFLGTYIFKIPTGLGYIHLGDGFIYAAASILPLPYAMAAAAIGGGLADLIAGYALWIPATVLIKAISVIFFKATSRRLLCARNVLAMIFGAIINIAGYYLYGSLVQGNMIACLAEIPFNAVQETAGGIVFVIMSVSLDLAKGARKLIAKQLGTYQKENSNEQKVNNL